MGSPCEFLEWDSSFFGCRVATVTSLPEDATAVSEIESWCRTERIDCVYCLVPASAGAAVRCIEEHGFRLVDVRVTLAWAPADLASGVNAPVGSDGGVRPVTPDDVATLCAIARVNHRVTRFYNDPGFPTVRCDALYETWIRKSCDGDADAVFVYESGGAAVGYLTCHLDDDRRGRIGLAGLAPEARALGFGGSLVQAAQRWFVEHDVAVVTVVSQGRNREGQRLYQRYGFITDDTALWFHRWFSGSPGAKR